MSKALRGKSHDIVDVLKYTNTNPKINPTTHPINAMDNVVIKARSQYKPLFNVKKIGA
jgi:hypothetical protein